MQDQSSLYDQLVKAMHILNEKGLYDASDFIRGKVLEMEKMGYENC